MRQLLSRISIDLQFRQYGAIFLCSVLSELHFIIIKPANMIKLTDVIKYGVAAGK